MGLENGKSVFEYLSSEVFHCYLHSILASLSVVVLLYKDEQALVNLFSPLEICSKYQRQYDTEQFPFFFNQSRNKDTFNLVSFRRIEAIQL